jgi:hypothetical protein
MRLLEQLQALLQTNIRRVAHVLQNNGGSEVSMQRLVQEMLGGAAAPLLQDCMLLEVRCLQPALPAPAAAGMPRKAWIEIAP